MNSGQTMFIKKIKVRQQFDVRGSVQHIPRTLYFLKCPMTLRFTLLNLFTLKHLVNNASNRRLLAVDNSYEFFTWCTIFRMISKKQ